MRSSSRITLGDILSSAMQTDMARLRDHLERQVRATIRDQLAKPKAPPQSVARIPPLPVRTPSYLPKRLHRHEPTRKKPVPRSAKTIPRSFEPLEKPRTMPPKQLSRLRPATFEFWNLPPEAAVREAPPTPNQSHADFERLVSVGSSTDPGVGEELFVTIGLDFGTSTTKVIVRFPYEAGTPTIAIPAPVPCSNGQPYLWQTVLWLDPNGEFKPWPDQDSHLLYALKQGVMGKDSVSLLTSGVTRAEAAAAFLGYVIRHTRGWLLENRPNIFRRRRPVWSVNVGLPAANFDNVALASTYRRVAAAALALANFPNAVTVTAARAFLEDPHVCAAGGSAEEAAALGVAVVPETAAEVAGFAKSTSRAPGLFLMVDVGAMTLDICAFRLHQRRPGEDLYALLLALVPPLGVEAYYWFRRQEKTEAGFIEQADAALHGVVWNTKRVRDPHAECWKPGNDLPVFLAGGGAKNELHRARVASLHPWLRQFARNDGIRLLELPIPENIELPLPVAGFGRLAVAWGLSYPVDEIGDILSPSDLDDIVPPKATDVADRFISKDQV
jgi:hypothetical protein